MKKNHIHPYFIRAAIIILLTSHLTSCSAPSATQHGYNESCRDDVKTIYGACRISPLHLLASPRLFSGTSIDVILYYPGRGSRFFFINPSAADAADLTEAFFINDEDTIKEHLHHPGYYRIEGTFITSPPIPFGEGVTISEAVGGRLLDITKIKKSSKLTDMLDECNIEECEVIYAEGAYLTIRIKNN